MNILITGGAGFIGSNLALRLKEKNHKVTILDNLSSQVHREGGKSFLYQSVKDEVRCIIGDATKIVDWIEALEGQEAVVHLAAETGTGQSMYEINKYIDTNVGGTARLLDILTNKKHSVQKVIIASSRAIYGEGKYQCQEHGIIYPESRNPEEMIKGDFHCKCPICNKSMEPLPTDEASRINPSSVYGITKYNQEQLVLTVCKSIGIPAIALRYQNVYGPGQSLSNPYTGILSIFSNQIKNGEELNIFEDGKESRDFVYISDAVRATILCIEKDSANFEALNVGSGRLTTVETVVKNLIKHYGNNAGIRVSGNYRLGDIRHNYADLKKIEKMLGYEPNVDFEQGIKKFTNWVMTQNIEKCDYRNSLEEMKKRNLFHG